MVSKQFHKQTAKLEKMDKADSDYLGYILTFDGVLLLLFAGLVNYSLGVVGNISYIIILLFSLLFLYTIVITFIEMWQKKGKYFKRILICSVALLTLLIIYGIIYASIAGNLNFNFSFGNSNASISPST